MKKKRLDRDLKWGFQYFPYYQMRVDIDCFHGLVCFIQLTDGEFLYWNSPLNIANDYLRTKRTPSVPGPQWQETVQPACVQ